MKSVADANNEGPSLPPWFVGRDFAAQTYQGVTIILPPLCSLSAGIFLMGRAPGHDLPDPKGREPQHTVWVAAFAIGRYPVTVAEYDCFVQAGGSPPATHGQTAGWSSQLNRPEHPVVRVTWDQANEYAHWLAEMTSQPWRLPTEAEWEKAARWDTHARYPRLYPWSDHFDRSRANTRRSGPGETTPVGAYPAGESPCGAQDMAGNVWEWTSSYFAPYPYTAHDGRESLHAGSASFYYRVRRGGSWADSERHARCAHRSFDVPFLNTDTQGFRLACDAR